MFVYVIASETAVKIGVSGNVANRLASLQTSNASKLWVACSLKCVDESAAYRLEKLLHDRYRAFSIRGEWFEVDPTVIVQDVRFALIAYDLIGSVDFRIIPANTPPRDQFPIATIAALGAAGSVLSCNLIEGTFLPLWAIVLIGLQGLAASYHLYRSG